jgi:hypothetical protein
MLFKTSAKLKEFAQLSGDINFASISATIRWTEIAHIQPVLGFDLYTALNDAYTAAADESTLTDPHKKLLEYCRMVIAPYVCYYYAPKVDVRLSDSGMTKHKDAAYQEQRTTFREANLREGEQASEALLMFLEEKKGDYAQWTDSTAFKKYKSLFIKTGTEFNELFPSASPYRNYWAMRSKMLQVEEQNIRKALGDTLFNALKTKDKLATPGFTEKEKILLEKLKYAIANFTVAFSVPMLTVRIDTNGITVSSEAPRTNRDEDAKRSASADNQLSLLIKSCHESGTTWLNDAIKYLNDNAADFTGWAVEEDDDTSPNEDLTGLYGMV